MTSPLFTPTADNTDVVLPPLPETPPHEATTSHTDDTHHDTAITPAIKRVKANENQAITRTDDRLDETNWAVWRHRLMLMLQICGVQDYVTGTVNRPDTARDPEGAGNWDFNDAYARVLIANNVTTTQMVHISQSRTAYESWSNLEVVHNSKSHQTTIGIMHNMFHTNAEIGNNNISDHLNKLKMYWERINLTADNNFKISDNQFKVLISTSLPHSWDSFSDRHGYRKPAG